MESASGQEEEEVRLRETIMVRVDDLVINFVYYDRKEDDELSAADIGKRDFVRAGHR